MPLAPRNALVGLVAARSTGEVLWKHEVKPIPSTEALLASGVRHFGGTDADYVVGYLSDATAYQRYKAGDSNTIAVSQAGVVTVSFAQEADVIEIRIAIAAGEFEPVGGSVNVIASTHLNGAPLSLFSEAVYVPMKTPSGVAFMRLNFAAGAAAKALVLSTPGEWAIPRHRNRIGTQWKIETAATVKAHL